MCWEYNLFVLCITMFSSDVCNILFWNTRVLKSGIVLFCDMEFGSIIPKYFLKSVLQISFLYILIHLLELCVKQYCPHCHSMLNLILCCKCKYFNPIHGGGGVILARLFRKCLALLNRHTKIKILAKF